MQNNLTTVLEIAKPKIDEMVANFKSHHASQENARPLTEFDIQMYELDITIDLIKAFGRYIKPTDQVSEVAIGKQKGVIVISCIVIRDVRYYMETEMIIAGGHNIQARHYRYITKTKLSANSNNVAAVELIEKKKRLTKVEAIKKEIVYQEAVHQRRLTEYNTLKALTHEQVYADHRLNEWSWDKLNEGGRRNYGSKESFDNYLAIEKERVWTSHLNRISEGILKAINKEHYKKIEKLKMKKLLS